MHVRFFLNGKILLLRHHSKLIMEKVERLEQLHRKMIEEVQDYAIILLDIDGTILTWKKGAEAIKGYRPHEITGQNFDIFYLPQDRQ